MKGVTLSAEQLLHAKSRVRENGLEDKVALELRDYRDIVGSFDRIVSIEMVEAVGEAFWPDYFRALHDRLRPAEPSCCRPSRSMSAASNPIVDRPTSSNAMSFRAACFPQESALLREAEKVGLSFSFSEHFGESYARTLSEWRRRFLASRKSVEAMGFSEEFHRMWDYYLSYSEGGFRRGSSTSDFTGSIAAPGNRVARG